MLKITDSEEISALRAFIAEVEDDLAQAAAMSDDQAYAEARRHHEQAKQRWAAWVKDRPDPDGRRQAHAEAWIKKYYPLDGAAYRAVNVAELNSILIQKRALLNSKLP